MGDSDRLSFTCSDIEAAPQILSESRLRYLGRSLPTLIDDDRGANDDVSSRIQQLQKDLLHTAKSNHLSPSHGAASVNALCRFLDICSTSQNETWRSFCYSFSTCTDLICLILDGSEIFRSKPTRQLLVTLSKLLLAHPNQPEKRDLIFLISSRCVRSIRKEEDAKSIKSCLNALEYLIKWGDFAVTSIIIASITGQSASVQKTREILFEETQLNLRPRIEDFIARVLEWMPYPDCAPAISRFLPSFLAFLDSSLAANSPTDVRNGGSAEITFWIEPVRQSLRRDIGFLESFENHLLPKLLCLSVRDRKSFLETLPFDDLRLGHVGRQADADIHLCLLAAKVMILNPDPSDSGPSMTLPTRVPDLDALCINLVGHASANIRIAAFSMMTSSIKTTAPLPSRVLTCLRQCIPNFHQETDSKIRNEFIAKIKRLCVRLSGAVRLCSRFKAKSSLFGDSSAEFEKNLTEHVQIIKWYQQFLLHELWPTASYQRHITALKVVPFVFEKTILSRFFFSIDGYHTNGEPNQSMSHRMHKLTLLRPLLDLIANPFDDIRVSAFEALSFLYPSIIHTDWADGEVVMSSHYASRDVAQLECVNQVETAHTLAEEHVQRSGRADHADGLGRLSNFYVGLGLIDPYKKMMGDKDPFNSILHKLQQSLQAIEQDLTSDVLSFPLHGHLISLRYIISRADFVTLFQKGSLDNPDVQDLYTILLSCCHKVWSAVKSVLCYDAPEGRLMYNFEDEEDDDSDDKSKDKLSFCWRALKESSLLMRAVIEQGKIGNSSTAHELHENDYEIYGQLIFTQLVELRHRGAFSTVAQTFAAWCVACSRSKHSNVSKLPKRWYQVALTYVQRQASALTRRSAGLPAVITGILAPYPNASLFDDVILDLQAIADGPIEKSEGFAEQRLPQVHALNCLKDIFVDSRYGASTEAHMDLSLGIAISSLESNVWAIRNCGLMFLQALLKRLNRGADTASTRVASLHRQSSPLIYEKFPVLSDLLLRLIRNPSHEKSSALQAQRIFPALEIIERFGVPKDDQKKEEIWRSFMQYLANPEWAIREKAARTMGAIMSPDDLQLQVRNLIDHGDHLSPNEVHGRLMVLRILFARATPVILNSSKVEAQSDSPFALLLQVVEKHVTNISCPIIVETVLNIVMDVVEDITCLKDNTSLHDDISRIYHLLRKREEYHVSEDSLLHFGNSSEINAISRCLRSLKSVVLPGGKCNTEDVAHESGTVLFQQVFSPNLLYDGYEKVYSSPEQSCNHLRLWGGQVAHSYLETAGATISFIPWTRALILAMNALSEVSTRLAAVASIESFCVGLYDNIQDSSSQKVPIELLTSLYDTLVDDDEDVRANGARVVSLILSKSSSDVEDESTSLSFSPPLARSKLLEHIMSTHSQSTTLVLEAVWRLTSVSETLDVVSRTDMLQNNNLAGILGVGTDKWRLIPVSVLLEEATYSQNVVFEEEKQNLYLDPVMEAESWSQVLIDIPLDVWPLSLLATVYFWADSGLGYLLDSLDIRKDSPLGFTSKADVYTLFMRVILMARVVILTFAKSHAANYRDPLPNIDSASLAWRLQDFYERGHSNGLHPLILDRIERILEEIHDIAE